MAIGKRFFPLIEFFKRKIGSLYKLVISRVSEGYFVKNEYYTIF